MGCTGFKKHMEPYLSGDLTGKVLKRFEKHINECTVCREEMARLRVLTALLDQVSQWQAEPPPYLAQRILSRLPDKPGSGIRTWKFFHPLVAALSLVIALGLGYMIRDTALREQAVPSMFQQVRIIFFSPEASSVALIGDFNEWGQRDVAVSSSSDRGVWEFTMTLKPGVYHYNLLVDGKRWVANPKASTLVPDGFGGYNSVLVVSEKCRDDCA